MSGNDVAARNTDCCSQKYSGKESPRRILEHLRAPASHDFPYRRLLRMLAGIVGTHRYHRHHRQQQDQSRKDTYQFQILVLGIIHPAVYLVVGLHMDIFL